MSYVSLVSINCSNVGQKTWVYAKSLALNRLTTNCRKYKSSAHNIIHHKGIVGRIIKSKEMLAVVCENSMCMPEKTVGTEEHESHENDSQSSVSSCESSSSTPPISTITIENKSLIADMPQTAITTTLVAAALICLALYIDYRSNLFENINNQFEMIASGRISPLIMSASTLANRISNTGFYQAFSLVLVSEIGDKTFFIAGLLAMKAGKVISFAGSISALAAMTVLSVIIGQLFHAVPVGISQGIPFKDLAAVVAFAFFGIKTLKEASELEDGDSSGMDEEYADAEEAVKGSRTIKQISAWGKIVSTFGLVFAAEFGDRSFISTIALSAAQNPISVGVGAVSGHAIATSIAVTGGSYIAKHISEKTIGSIAGCLFLIFAITTGLGLF